MVVTKHLRIYGRVQGVFFRESMRGRAVELGVSGWVRNRRDGWLEAVFHGHEQPVEELIRWTRRGPSAAHVERMDVEDRMGEFAGFEILKTA